MVRGRAGGSLGHGDTMVWLPGVATLTFGPVNLPSPPRSAAAVQGVNRQADGKREEHFQ